MEGGVLDTHESIAKAAVMQLDELGVDMSTSKMSRSIRDKTEIVGPSGSYYFRKKV
jgi:predicted S18 family serine protease